MRLGVTVAYARVRYGGEPTLKEYEEFARWAAAMGFAGVELAAFSCEHFSRDFGDPDAVHTLGARCRALGLAVNAFEAGHLRHMTVSEDAGVRRRAVAELGQALDAAQALGTDLVYLHSAPHPSWAIEFRRLYDEFTPPISAEIPPGFAWQAAWAQYVDTVGAMARLAEGKGVRLALEIRPYEMVSNADGASRLIEAIASPALGVVFDTGHLLVQKELLPIAIEKLAGRIFLVHLADNDGVQDYHWAPGRGTVPWEGVLRALAKVGYAGFVNIDVAGAHDDLGAEIRAGRDFIRERMPAQPFGKS